MKSLHRGGEGERAVPLGQAGDQGRTSLDEDGDGRWEAQIFPCICLVGMGI